MQHRCTTAGYLMNIRNNPIDRQSCHQHWWTQFSFSKSIQDFHNKQKKIWSLTLGPYFYDVSTGESHVSCKLSLPRDMSPACSECFEEKLSHEYDDIILAAPYRLLSQSDYLSSGKLRHETWWTHLEQQSTCHVFDLEWTCALRLLKSFKRLQVT